ncbi:serine/threonine-protein kinase H1 homolog [Micropterus dolomieu]|uniref:serine/threonine-protein kinase H1 homolog n=1 Tax=Micropterus dolomieu TaxID=147949 RepID=UPI001E8DFBEF|nr:serine/threonine-protein kinase H1 homolog [Micropterus dolomieu]
MGCGNSKVLPGASNKGYVSVVQSLVAFSKVDDDNEPKKRMEKQRHPWFSTSINNFQTASNGQQQTLSDGRHQDKVPTYKDKFDPRVTARYDIKALIGRGSFSRVVRVEHRATRQPFAIKMMEVEAPEGREVCTSELVVLQRVSHSNVIQLIEVFQFPQRVYMVLELATGGELLDRVVSRGHFTERDATQALRMVLAGVEYLHNLGITHRDLKPENLLYYHPGADSRLLVTDFGLATFGGAGSEVLGPDRSSDGGADRTWSLRTTCGTPEYMAPEVLQRKPYSCAVDMWALGVITYIVLSGSMPFEDDSRMVLYRAIVRGKYSFYGDPWPSVSNLAKDFIQRLLPLDPATRLTASQAIRHPWVVTMAASSSMRNLHRSISQNLRQRTSQSSSRCPSSTASSGDSSSVGPGRLTSLEKKQQQQQVRASGLTQPQRAIHHPA